MKWSLKAIRANLNLDQREMAEKIGVSRESWQNYENYKSFPTIRVIKKIVEVSNIDFNDIIFLPEEFAKSEQKEK